MLHTANSLDLKMLAQEATHLVQQVKAYITPAVVPQSPATPTVAEIVAEQLKAVPDKIQRALQAGEWKTAAKQYPFHCTTDDFLNEMNRRLPKPFVAVDDSTSGWDATEMWCISWLPEGATLNQCKAAIKALAKKD